MLLSSRAAVPRLRRHRRDPARVAPRHVRRQGHSAQRRLGQPRAARLRQRTCRANPGRHTRIDDVRFITEADGLRAALVQTRSDGYAITTGERESGASGISAPVFDSAADVIGAITISGPTVRMPESRCEEWVELLVSHAEQITRTLGGRYPA
ncbi:MAG: IclR family transcriptional regulator C-terminal domain-containing protein [Rhodococcus sp. (in: high G+C Gram-positive bacteria)]